MSFFSFLKKLNRFKRAEPTAAAPRGSFAAFIEQARKPLTKGPTWSTEKIAELEAQPAIGPRDLLDGFLHFGEWIDTYHSSNVASIHYDPEAEQLQIQYKNGNYYQYQNVSIQEAEQFARAASRGKWVWDHLRRRGTVFGWRKPYMFLNAVSAGRMPQWMRKAEYREEHGTIPPSGEKDVAQLVRLMPRGWHRAAAKFRVRSGH